MRLQSVVTPPRWRSPTKPRANTAQPTSVSKTWSDPLVSRPRKWAALSSAVVLGVVLVSLVLLLDTDVGGMAVGAAVLVVATTLVRTGVVDRPTG